MSSLCGVFGVQPEISRTCCANFAAAAKWPGCFLLVQAHNAIRASIRLVDSARQPRRPHQDAGAEHRHVTCNSPQQTAFSRLSGRVIAISLRTLSNRTNHLELRIRGFPKEQIMKTRTRTDTDGITKRAAEIRGSWSVQERRRRMGLPPDTPMKLKEFFLTTRTSQWPTVSQSS
jgi:hypothetical protein